MTTVASVGSVGDSTSFVLDDDGMIHVAFSDESANVLRYANLSTGVSVTRRSPFDSAHMHPSLGRSSTIGRSDS